MFIIIEVTETIIGPIIEQGRSTVSEYDEQKRTKLSLFVDHDY